MTGKNDIGFAETKKDRGQEGYGHEPAPDEGMVGPPGTGKYTLCKCPECHTVIRHKTAEHCEDHGCPKCGTAMKRHKD